MFNIGIIGNGFVGKATNLLLSENINSFIYDKEAELCEPKNLRFEDLNQCHIIFICVPTPMNKDGSIHLDIVKSVVKEIKLKLKKDIFIVIRSTVLPGTSLNLGTFFMPEFLTEKILNQILEIVGNGYLDYQKIVLKMNYSKNILMIYLI